MIGPDAKAAISALSAGLKCEDSYLRVRCAVALPAIDSGMDRTALPVLLKSLRDDKSYIRVEAISGLGKIGSYLEDALQAIAGALKDEDRSC